MSKSYKNAFYSKCLDIYTSIVYGMDGDGGGEKEDEGDMSIRTSIYNKFIDLYGLYYKNEEFIIPITTKNIDSCK